MVVYIYYGETVPEMAYFDSHQRVKTTLWWDRLSDRANLLLLGSAWLLNCLHGTSVILLLCPLCTNHLVERTNVIQETKAGVNAKNLVGKKVVRCGQPG